MCIYSFLSNARDVVIRTNVKMLYLAVLVYFSILTVSHSAPPKTTTKTFWDIPSGHCEPICTCQMNGLYYSEGEQWAKPEDPCTIYKCFKNGFFEAVQKDYKGNMYYLFSKRTVSGCWYKEQCHVINNTWSEGCNTFTCTENADEVYYKLTEAACPLPTGGCLTVGARWESGCDVMECQIDGACLKLKTVRTECAVQGSCKRIDSYWHDGCTVYMCANDNQRAMTRSLANEPMQWPDGNYAILKPLTGCPSDVPSVWSEGSRKHYGAGQNLFSNILSLSGNYTEEFMQHNFCNHGIVPSNETLPRFKTYWEPGSYCILRRNGSCPRGFSDGYVSFDDNQGKAKSVSSGDLPDGDFSTKTGLYFCCRKDGSVLTEIILPKDENFVLFMENGETECQTVRGMTHSVEYVTFNGLPSAKHETRGLTPSVKILNGDITINLCHYKTMECGCSDPSGEFIAVNTEKEINCVIKKCVSEMGINILKIVSGGCPVNGKCQAEGSKWKINFGETCKTQTCEKIATGTDVTYAIKDGSQGCRDGDVCKKVGEEIYRGCYTSRCSIDSASNTTVFKVIEADCPWLDSCKKPNTTWEYNCLTYRCDMNVEVGGHYQWNVQPIKYGCNDGNGNCFGVGENVTGRCFDAVCRLSENKTVVFLDVTKGGCTWKDGCKAVNATWRDGCHAFKCEWIHTETGFTAIVNATSVSCQWNSMCYKQDDVWSDGCIDYKCIVTRQAEKVNWSVQTVHLGCSSIRGNSCIEVGKETTENCVTYKCNVKGDEIGLDAVTVGCYWNDTCYTENKTWNDTAKCIEYQCRKDVGRISKGGQSTAAMQVLAIGYGCIFNQTCMAVNSTWSDGCRTRKCVVYKRNNMIHRSIAPVAAGCDDEGICRHVGYQKVTPTCMFYECIFNETYKDSFFSLTKGSCRSDNGTCYDVGKTWTEQKKNSCIVYKCKKETLGYLSKMIEQQCVDSEGNCKAVGSSGFSAIAKGKLQKNCSCIAPKNQGPIEIHCKG